MRAAQSGEATPQTPASLRITGDLATGRPFDREVTPGSAVRILNRAQSRPALMPSSRSRTHEPQAIPSPSSPRSTQAIRLSHTDG